jgi:hypothetical protein
VDHLGDRVLVAGPVPPAGPVPGRRRSLGHSRTLQFGTAQVNRLMRLTRTYGARHAAA